MGIARLAGLYFWNVTGSAGTCGGQGCRDVCQSCLKIENESLQSPETGKRDLRSARKVMMHQD